MLSTERESDVRGYGPNDRQGWVYVVVDHHDRAKAAGATIIRELDDQDYGSRDYSARDSEGNIWSFGTHNPATAPAEAPRGASSSAS